MLTKNISEEKYKRTKTVRVVAVCDVVLDMNSPFFVDNERVTSKNLEWGAAAYITNLLKDTELVDAFGETHAVLRGWQPYD